jgi:hypothetical protein
VSGAAAEGGENGRASEDDDERRDGKRRRRQNGTEGRRTSRQQKRTADQKEEQQRNSGTAEGRRQTATANEQDGTTEQTTGQTDGQAEAPDNKRTTRRANNGDGDPRSKPNSFRLTYFEHDADARSGAEQFDADSGRRPNLGRLTGRLNKRRARRAEGGASGRTGTKRRRNGDG